MGLENATKISELVATNPQGSDPKSQGDDHLRMIKQVLQNNAIKSEIGLSATPANNFVLDASADNGTMKLQRESGQDIMTVDAAGKVAFPQLPTADGHAKLPGGLQICWGTGVTDGTGGVYQPFPVVFASPPKVVVSFSNPTAVAVSLTVGQQLTTGFECFTQNSAEAGVAAAFSWIAIGLAP